MNIAEVVAKMNVYLLNAADVCRKWLEPRLKSLEPSDWWNMIVLPSLSELQQRKVNEKGISTLQGLDLQAALTVARKNIYSFRNIEYYADYYGMKDSISAMFEVRNDWAHPTPEEVTLTMTKTDLSRYIDFMERFGGSRAEINEAKEFRASVEMPNYGNPIRIQEPSSCAEEQSASPAVQSAPVKVLENPFVVGAKVVRKSNPDQVGMIGNIRGSGDSTEYEVMFMDTGFGTYYADQLLLADASPERCNVSIDELKILPCVAIIFDVLLQRLNLNHSFLCGLDRIRKRIEPGRQIFNMSSQIIVVAQAFFLQQNHSSGSFFSIELLRPLFITDRLTLGHLCLNINQHLELLRGRSLGRAAF